MVCVSSGYSASEVNSGFSCLYRVFRKDACLKRSWRGESTLQFCEMFLTDF